MNKYIITKNGEWLSTFLDDTNIDKVLSKIIRSLIRDNTDDGKEKWTFSIHGECYPKNNIVNAIISRLELIQFGFINLTITVTSQTAYLNDPLTLTLSIHKSPGKHDSPITAD